MRFLVLDTETGSLDAKTGALCSVGAVLLDENLEIIEEYYTLVNEPEKIYTFEAMQVNGLSRDEIAEKGRAAVEVMKDISELLDSDEKVIMVNHNSSFDVAWLNERGFNIRESIDTLMIARSKWPGQKNNLGVVCERLGISVDDAHNSLGDSRMTVKVLRELAKMDKKYLDPKPIDFDYFKTWKK